MTPLRILSAGAAKGLVGALAPAFEAASGRRIEAAFDAAGTIRRAFEQDASVDLVILPDRMLDELAAEGLVVGPITPIGVVATGVAIRHGGPVPRIDDADSLGSALRAASSLYCPDTEHSTAGRHFVGVLRALGIEDAARGKLRAYPNGAQAMAALAREERTGPLGCTQVTEILYTPGVALVGPLPAPFELSTRYAIAQATRARSSETARAFAARLTGPESEAQRRAGGFAGDQAAA